MQSWFHLALFIGRRDLAPSKEDFAVLPFTKVMYVHGGGTSTNIFISIWKGVGYEEIIPVTRAKKLK